MGTLDAAPGSQTTEGIVPDSIIAASRAPLVLISPCYTNPVSRRRFADTLARPVPFTETRVRKCLTDHELIMLLTVHPSKSARFWGAFSKFDAQIDGLIAGDVILFTGQKRVQAVGRVGCKLRNKSLADALWTPDISDGRSWNNVYTILDFQSQPDLTYEAIREAAGYKPNDYFMATRVLSPDKSKAVIARLRLNSADITVVTDLDRGTHGSPESSGQDVPAVSVARNPAGSGQLDWTREEIILAMDFYITCGAINGGPVPGQHTVEIAGLSTLLKTLSAYPPEVQGEKYRNTHGVYLKLMNLRAVQTGGAHGMTRISQADAAVWRDFIDNLDDLHAEAAAIRQRLAEGVLTPASTTAPAAEDVPIENRNTERFMTTPSGEPREAERAEAALVHRYQAYMTAKGIAVSRKKYRAGQVRPMFCDLWVQDRHALIEAKNSDSRERLRMAIGQLCDYRRFHGPPVHLAVLLPHQPGPDGLALLQSIGIEAIWPHGTGFRDSANGTFV
jgi:hypothetical protein